LDDLDEHAEHYRDVAAALLAIARAVMDPERKGALLDVSIKFLDMADHVERRQVKAE
jgi:hypothetical protein